MGKPDVAQRVHICEQCLKHGPWDRSTWRHVFAPSRIDGNFPTKFCSEECEQQWMAGEAGAVLPRERP